MYTIRWITGRQEFRIDESDLDEVLESLRVYRTGLTLKTKLGTIVGFLIPEPNN